MKSVCSISFAVIKKGVSCVQPSDAVRQLLLHANIVSIVDSDTRHAKQFLYFAFMFVALQLNVPPFNLKEPVKNKIGADATQLLDGNCI